MEERAACALLKARFEAAGFRIEDNRPFDEHDVQFEIDGYDPRWRVGYEYLTEEAGDGWDVDQHVIAVLEARRLSGDVFVLVVDEHEAPDAASLDARAEAFLSTLRDAGVDPTIGASTAPDEIDVTESTLVAEAEPTLVTDIAKIEIEAEDATKTARVTTKPATKKTATKKTATKKTATKKTATKKTATKKTATKKTATKKTATNKTAANKTAANKS